MNYVAVSYYIVLVYDTKKGTHISTLPPQHLHIFKILGVWGIHRLIRTSKEIFHSKHRILEDSGWLMKCVGLRKSGAYLMVHQVICSTTLFAAVRHFLALCAS